MEHDCLKFVFSKSFRSIAFNYLGGVALLLDLLCCSFAVCFPLCFDFPFASRCSLICSSLCFAPTLALALLYVEQASFNLFAVLKLSSYTVLIICVALLCLVVLSYAWLYFAMFPIPWSCSSFLFLAPHSFDMFFAHFGSSCSDRRRRYDMLCLYLNPST